MSMFGKRLRSLLEENDIEGKDFAKHMHVQPPTVSNWLNGNRFPKEDFILNIAEYFDVSTDYLLGKSDIKNPYYNGSEEENIHYDNKTVKNKEANQDVEEKRLLVENFINQLMDDGVIKKGDDIDDNIAKIIINVIRTEVDLKLRERRD